MRLRWDSKLGYFAQHLSFFHGGSSAETVFFFFLLLFGCFLDLVFLPIEIIMSIRIENERNKNIKKL